MPTSPDAVSDDLILAAIDRSERHHRREDVSRSEIYDHLNIPSRAYRVRHIKAQVSALTEEGFLKHSRKHSVDIWTLTPKGRRRLKRANVERFLPESPQHRNWARTRKVAEQGIEKLRESLRAVLVETLEALDEPEGSVSSDTWFALCLRLEIHARLVGQATHCLHEWEEPDDAVADIDDHFHRGRRNLKAWDSDEDAETS